MAAIKAGNYVRWLGAYHKGGSLLEAAEWEISKPEREVACEYLPGTEASDVPAQIGLVADMTATQFVCGWLSDAYTWTQGKRLMATRAEQPKRYRSRKLFERAVRRAKTQRHTEVAIYQPVYKAVAVVEGDRNRRRIAQSLGDKLGLPVVIVRGGD